MRLEIGGDAALGDPAGDEGFELFAPCRVHLRRLVRGEERRGQIVGLAGGLRAAASSQLS